MARRFSKKQKNSPRLQKFAENERSARRPIPFVAQGIAFMMMAVLVVAALPYLIMRFMEGSLGISLLQIQFCNTLYWVSLLSTIVMMFFGIFAVTLHCVMTTLSLYVRHERPSTLTIVNTVLTLPSIYLILTAMDFLRTIRH